MSNQTILFLLGATLLVGSLCINESYSTVTDVPNSKTVVSFTYCAQSGPKGLCSKYSNGVETRIETIHVGPFWNSESYRVVH
jgi:hypothetical protein